MKHSDIICHETARMGTYRLLSELFQQPGNGLGKKVHELVRHLDSFDLNLIPHPRRMTEAVDRKEGIKHLLVDYSRLFVGPYSLFAPPYGSVYLDTERKVMGESTLDVLARYARFGIDVAEGFTDMPDHIAVELEFMYFLVCKELQSLHSGLLQQAYNILFEQKSFINDHLNLWIPDFSHLIDEHSNTRFYRCLAHTTQQYIAWDTAYLNQVRTLERQTPEVNNAIL